MTIAARPLLDDCFAHDPKRLPAAEALAMLRARIHPVVETETVPLAAAVGRIAAMTLRSERLVPAFDNAAVDGFACRHADLAPDRPTVLALAEGRAAAGHPYAGALLSGQALRVLTGAPMPAGADTALMQEDVARDGAAIRVPPGVRRGANCRLAGEDLTPGQVVVAAGRRLRPQDVGSAATIGRAALEVYRPLKVALLSSGDELAEPGAPLADGGTYDSNRVMLASLLAGLGCAVTDLGIVRDEAGAVEAALAAAAASHDAILASGGASRGDEDHMARAVTRLGRLHFWQIAVKPGRPLAFGQIGQAVFMGLPGNPVAAVICFLRFARPMLVALGGGNWPEPRAFQVPAAFSLRKKPGRREYLRGALRHDAAGRLTVARFPRDGSGILTSLVEADGLIELAEELTSVGEGEPVAFVPFSELGIGS
jgi:molybdopterin molybdotransferase